MKIRALPDLLAVPSRGPSAGRSAAERFWDWVDRTSDGCWEWAGALNDKGYGRFAVFQVTYPAHRIAWQLAFGPPPPELLVCHRCDNPRCVNPAHLFLGSQKDNLADRDQKGRGLWGARNGRAVLSSDDVAGIRDLLARGADVAPIARQFGVSGPTIRRIARGEGWCHAA